MGFVRRVISSALDIANLAKHNANFADIETDLSEKGTRLAAVETEQTAQSGRIDNIVASGGESNVEIVDARQPVTGPAYPVLGERLNAVDTQLAEKAAQSDLAATSASLTAGLTTKRDKATKITSADIDKTSDDRKIQLADLSEGVQAAMAGTAPVISNVEDGTITAKKYADGSVRLEKLNDSVSGYFKTGLNLLNPHTVTVGKYVSYGDGALYDSAGSAVAERIPVTGGAQYFKSGLDGGQCAFYNSAGTFISGLAAVSGVFTAPVGAAFVSLTLDIANVNTTMLAQSSIPLDFEPYALYEADSVIEHSIIVRQDGLGNTGNLVIAVQRANEIAGPKDTVNIYVHEGTYDIVDALYGGSLPSSDKGLILADNVNIIGVGDRNNVILQGFLPNGVSPGLSTAFSTLNIDKNNRLENVTVLAQNCRYPIHDDNGNTFKDYVRELINCRFVHYGNQSGLWDYTSAYGEGCSSGTRFYARDCVFESVTLNPAVTTNVPYGCHNNHNFAVPSYHRLDNCEFINHSHDIAVRFSSVGSGQREQVVFNNCKFSGYQWFFDDTPGTGNEFHVSGGGNSIVPSLFSQTVDSPFGFNFVDFAGEVIRLKNKTGSTLAKSALVQRSGYNGIESATTADIFLGVVLEDIAPGSVGAVRVAGFINANTWGLSTEPGDKYTVSGGVLTPTSGADYVAICTIEDTLLLR